MFNNTETGFALTFDNGYTISVQWGPMHYCGNRDLNTPWIGGEFQPYESRTAEIAATRPNGSYLQLGEYDDVVGWLLADEVARYITTLSGATPEDACHLQCDICPSTIPYQGRYSHS
jgi:hypothetical protein